MGRTNPATYTQAVPSLSPRALIGVIATVILGGFIAFLQFGLVTGLGVFGWGAASFQGSLETAADNLGAGEFERAQSDFAATSTAADAMVWSAGLPQVQMIGSIAGLDIAAANWRTVAAATDSVTTGTDELLSLYGDLSGASGNQRVFSDGVLNLDLLRDLPPRVEQIDTDLNTAALLLNRLNTNGPGADLLARAQSSAQRQVVPVQEAISALTEIAPLLPDALGANGPRRYLIAIANQAEMRASAGAPLSLVMIEFDQGRISIPIKGTTSIDLFPPVNRPVDWWGPAGNPFFPINPRTAPFVNSNTHPNLLYSGREMSRAWVAGDYPEVDGVAVLDLTAISAVLAALGPIESPVYGTVTADQLGQILLIDAYAEFGQEEAATRQAANQQLLDELLAKILSGDDLVTSVRAIASTAPGRHFQVWMQNAAMQSVAEQSGAGGVVEDPRSGDWSAIFTQNGNQSKVDVFQQRNVLVAAQLAEDGSARVTQQVTVTNATPPERPEGPLERVGYETSWVRNAYLLYIPDAATNFRVQYPDGFAVRPFRNHAQFGQGFVNDGFGQKLVRVAGWTPPGGQAAVSVSYELPPGTFSSSAGAPVLGGRRLVYRLTADPQAIWNPATLTVRVTGPPGRVPVPIEGALVTGNTIEVSAIQDGPVTLRLPFVQESS